MKLTEKQSADLVRTCRKVSFPLRRLDLSFFLQFILMTYAPEMTAGWRSILYTADAIENIYDSEHDLLIFMDTAVFSVIVFFSKGRQILLDFLYVSSCDETIQRKQEISALTHCILVGSSTVICWARLFVI